jgi:hypothetical protein
MVEASLKAALTRDDLADIIYYRKVISDSFCANVAYTPVWRLGDPPDSIVADCLVGAYSAPFLGVVAPRRGHDTYIVTMTDPEANSLRVSLGDDKGYCRPPDSFGSQWRNLYADAYQFRIALALDVQLRQQNALLLTAGFAPAWRESDRTAPELATVNHVLDHMLAQQEPFPAILVDRRWNVLRANLGARWLMAFLDGPSLPPASTGTVNMAEWLMSPDGLRP